MEKDCKIIENDIESMDEKNSCCANTRHLNQRNDKKALLKRLNRIEGQVKGIGYMIESDRYCVDVLNQISAVKSAINAVGNILLENHIRGCVLDAVANEEEDRDEVMGELIRLINRYSK